ncbi:LOW QUALITY PROTEIN: hypothetical protein Cgig2_006653 [Carnegiea gigantea]|uniref:DUF4283 domain-containing protein n=1 Tax=Carnegiea gigantea TaxID=171969 RepID=A0A9Q1GY14_9CARY|nr:LOW QUALITY PROTEIN: hypothetical protein Cgig2_006653 [Carnegiea gigantea]
MEHPNQPPGATLSTVDRNNHELSPRIEREANGIVQREIRSTTLDFIPTSEINGIKCAKIVVDDIEEEIAYWQNAVVCCVLGANPLVEVIDGFVRRIWKEYAIDKVMLIKKGLYLVRFLDAQDVTFYCQNLDSRNVHRYRPNCIVTNLDQFPELDIKYWGGQCLGKLGSILGIPLKTDKYTKKKTMLRYARLLVEMPIDQNFPDYIEFAKRCRVKYEWLPLKCTHCRMFRHTQETYNKKGMQKKEWRIKSRTIPHTTQQPQDQTQVPAQQIERVANRAEKEFQTVTQCNTKGREAYTHQNAIRGRPKNLPVPAASRTDRVPGNQSSTTECDTSDRKNMQSLWDHNVTQIERDRIIVSWNPTRYSLDTPKNRSIDLWRGHTAIHIQKASSNLCLWKEFRGPKTATVGYSYVMGGLEVTDGEIRDYANCLRQLHKFNHIEAYFTWTNKTI